MSCKDSIEYIIQRWAESELYGSYGAGWGGKESIQEWIKRGPYYHFNWPSKASKATEVLISSQFSKQFFSAVNYEVPVLTGASNILNTWAQVEERPQLLLFDHYIKSFDLVVEMGKVRRVVKRDL